MTDHSVVTAERVRAQEDIRGVEGTRVPVVQGLMVFAFIGGVLGLVFTSQATLGVAVIAFSILLAIAARIAQANAQHAALMKRIR